MYMIYTYINIYTNNYTVYIFISVNIYTYVMKIENNICIICIIIVLNFLLRLRQQEINFFFQVAAIGSTFKYRKRN